jgi:hypothetical protein
MTEKHVTIPEIVLIAGTRVVLGLLLADRLTEDQRRAVGWALVAVGALTTIPLAAEVLGRDRLSTSASLEIRPDAVSP